MDPHENLICVWIFEVCSLVSYGVLSERGVLISFGTLMTYTLHFGRCSSSLWALDLGAHEF